MKTLLFLAIFLPAALHAQIYADFTVRKGTTSLGTFRVLLEHTKAPRTCANFIGLATGRRPWIDLNTGRVRENKPFYNGLTFHRLIHSFVIQGGSPNGQGTDGPGYAILDEYHPELRHSSQYVLSMAKSSTPNSGGSQFFITLRATPELNDKHAVFGSVISGSTIIDGFKSPANHPTGTGDKPVTPIVIDSVVVSGPSLAAFDINSSALRLPHVSATNFTIKRNQTASTMTAVFDRKAQTEYFAYGSANLQTWTPHGITLSMNPESAYQLAVPSRTEPKYFLRVTPVDYSQVPNAPSDLNNGSKTIRLIFAPGVYLNITPNSSGGGIWRDTSNRSGTLSQTVWSDIAPATGVFPVATASAQLIPLGDFRTTLQNYPSAGSSVRLETWLSFHTPTTGWTEEIGQGAVNRRPFEIITN